MKENGTRCNWIEDMIFIVEEVETQRFPQSLIFHRHEIKSVTLIPLGFRPFVGLNLIG